MPRFFTDDNLITALCLVHIQLHQLCLCGLNLKNLNNGHTLNSLRPIKDFPDKGILKNYKMRAVSRFINRYMCNFNI